MGILNNIKSPADIKKLDASRLETLAREIRGFLVESVSKTGGHLASNLGVVELTIALHRVFDTNRDKIVWDVGHQTYTHKILTGRKDEFAKLRSFGGISGFPKCCESSHDCFNTGHSSTSVSAALGIARARDLRGEKFSVVAVIGDGALTGGLAYEGLNNAGRMRTNFIVVLNDNEMSISKNVGGISKYLNKLRSAPSYFKAKKQIDTFLNKIPKVGGPIARQLQKAKDSIRYLLIESSIFEDLGFTYLGPIDGHNIDQMSQVLERAKGIEGPVLIHVYTKKGKGYSFAEDKPNIYHGIGSFDVDTGKQNGGSKSYIQSSKVFGERLVELAHKNKNIVAITAAMPDGTGLNLFASEFPERFYDVGIAEAHAVTFGAGLAAEGLTPVVAVYSTFLQRAYDQIFHDVGLQNLHVVFALDRSGIVGEDGETHHGIYDLSYLSHIPNISILAPSSPDMLRQMLDYAINTHNGPIAIRYNKIMAQDEEAYPFEFVRARIIKEGKDITLVSVGNMLETAKKAAEASGRDVEIIDLGTVKPLDIETLKNSISKTGAMIVLEDNVEIGGAGCQIECAIGMPVRRLGYADCPIPHGSYRELYKKCGVDVQSVAEIIKRECDS
ncbi:MAG: 1-deoxy-D-xylulose-5-phosphate synthase [Firmicutes bacterium ADurb.Bin193]|nr:MAG: 1-deoxy-D-xylulose-5-phosphate synthase [Firmicutes bacterium ADurb.Bin193]